VVASADGRDGSDGADPQPYGPPIGPKVARDTGAGELLLVVVGGVYPTRAEAQAANAQMVFGDLQGYYVVPVAQFQGFREQVGSPGDFALVSAFRTQEGASEFVSSPRRRHRRRSFPNECGARRHVRRARPETA
jgi:hypothetical protein